jgi:predicted AlkP superfamily phosphohydrolase/phosphomutase
MQRKATSLAVWLVALVCGIAASACDSPNRGRVILIGLDGATWRVARPLMDSGRLPNLARLAREGVSGSLRSFRPLLSPRIWNSIATGKTPEKHGIQDFTRDGELFTSHDRKVHALWNIASDADLSVAVINWWNTNPVERVRGVMVSDHLFWDEEMERETRSSSSAPEPLVFPEESVAKLSSLVDRGASPFGDPEVSGKPEGLPRWMSVDFLSRMRWQDAALTRLALEVEAETRPDLLMVLLEGIDRSSHVLWIGMESNEPYPESLHVSEAQRSAARAALEAHYELADRLVGRLLERYGPEDLVMVISDHAFEAGVDFLTLTGVHWSEAAAHGLLLARGPGIIPGDRAQLVTMLDVTPTILAWLGLPVGADMDGGVAPFLRGVRIATIRTHDGGTVQRLAGERSGAEPRILEELRALGYVE